ncbi:MAG: glycerate kinase [Candidatus Nanopelagicales bacterium]
MRVLIAPDAFGGTLSARQAAAAIARGWARTAPDDELDLAPLADGGPGFLDVLHASLGGDLVAATVSGPLRERMPAAVLVVGRTAYVESAQACGLHLCPTEARDPTTTTTYGVGELVTTAVAAGASEVVVGLGGSGTNDGGAGLLVALGATATLSSGADATGLLARGGAGLGELAAVDLHAVRDRLAGVGLVAATDVDSPLLGARGASAGFGPQKGATPEQVLALEVALAAYARAVGRRPDGRDPAVALGAGAAGGLGYALIAVGASRAAGIGTVMDAVELRRRIDGCDLVVTGEGCFDWQSLRGKVVAGVAALALERALPCLVLAGRVEVGRREYSPTGVCASYAVVDDVVSRGGVVADALIGPGDRLADLAERTARTWSR